MSSLFAKLAARPERSIILLSLLLLLAGNWILPLTDRDETRFAEASREMLQRGDYVVPWFNGHWRFDKPILIYWCQSASYRLFGVNDFAARLPSVVFTTLTAWLLVRWGRTLADARTAFLAGGMFLAGLHVAIIGRVATADMAMVFFFMVAVWSGWQLTRPERSSRLLWWWIFYVALALGFLAKGPVAWLPFGGLVLARLWRKDSFHLPPLETTLGLALTVVLTLLWGLPAQELTQGQYFKVGVGEHVIHRSTGVNDGHGLQGVGGFILTLPLYFLTFLVSFLPWSVHEPEGLEPWFGQLRRKGRWWSAGTTGLRWVFCIFYIPIRIRRWWPERGRDELGWYLLLQAFVVFAVFSCVRTKLPHYTLPAFPCIALWLALQIRAEAAAIDWFQKRFALMAIMVLVLMVGGGALVRQQFLTENLWRAVRSHMRPGTRVGCYGFTESSLVWKFRGITTNLVTLGEAKDADYFLTNPPPSILVIPTRELGSLMDTNGLLLQVHGLDLVRFRRWDLTAIVR